MALLYPDILQHNNSTKALVDITEIRGNSYPINLLSDTGSIPADKRKVGAIVFVSSSQNFYGFYGQTTGSWDTVANWRSLGGIDTGSFVTTSSFNSYTGSNTSQFAGTASTANALTAYESASADQINIGEEGYSDYSYIVRAQELEQSKHTTINIFTNLNFT